MKRQAFVQWIMPAVCLVFAASGCNTPKDNLMVFNRYVESGDLRPAATFAEDKLKKGASPRGEDLLWMLQLGAVERMEQRYAESTRWFDESEDTLQYFKMKNDEISRLVARAAINDNATPYSGTIYDGIMVNTYKALNFMIQGKYELARVEFNRALDRQRRAKEDFSRQIQSVQDRLRQHQNSTMAYRTLENPEFRSKLEQQYPSLSNFEAYPDFVNPFSTYLAGIFFAVTNDYSKASDLLKESAGMLPNNNFVLQDFAEVEKALNERKAISPTVWVIFENGLGPIKDEIRIDLPLFIATDKVRYFGIALPQLLFRPAAAWRLDIRSDDQSCATELVADMDRIIQTEFQKEFSGILLRALLVATAKAAAQYAFEENNSSPAAICMAFFNFFTTAADVRIWSALPKNFQVARLSRPADGKLTIGAGNRPPMTVQLPDCTHAIVYVKMITSHAVPRVDIIRF